MDTYEGLRARLWHKTGGGALGPWTGPGPGPMDRARAQGTLDRARAYGTLAYPRSDCLMPINVSRLSFLIQYVFEIFVFYISF